MNANQDKGQPVAELENAIGHSASVEQGEWCRVFWSPVISVFALTLAACCCAPPSSSSGSTGAGESTAQAVAPTKAPESAQRVEIATLLADYKGNEVRADQSYKGKLIETTGSVGDVKKSIGDSMYVTIGAGGPFEIPKLQCSLSSDQAGHAASLNKGERVTVRGHVSGLLFNVQMRDCRIQ